jgi:hypothetical protein
MTHLAPSSSDAPLPVAGLSFPFLNAAMRYDRAARAALCGEASQRWRWQGLAVGAGGVRHASAESISPASPLPSAYVLVPIFSYPATVSIIAPLLFLHDHNLLRAAAGAEGGDQIWGGYWRWMFLEH